jgi:hypothetical protein
MSVAILVFTAISSSLYEPQQSFNANAEQHNSQSCSGPQCNILTQTETNRTNNMGHIDMN